MVSDTRFAIKLQEPTPHQGGSNAVPTEWCQMALIFGRKKHAFKLGGKRVSLGEIYHAFATTTNRIRTSHNI